MFVLCIITERIYEEHENMVENLLMWTRDSKNKIYFVERDDKYDMFHNPQRYFMESRQDGPTSQNIRDSGPHHHGMDEHTKHGLIDEFFNQSVGVPEVESFLYLKAEGKKAWKKFAFVLRASGIYYYPKGRSHSSSSKDLVCLATIDHNQQVIILKPRIQPILNNNAQFRIAKTFTEQYIRACREFVILNPVFLLLFRGPIGLRRDWLEKEIQSTDRIWIRPQTRPTPSQVPSAYEVLVC